jgi:hypothetical protein
MSAFRLACLLLLFKCGSIESRGYYLSKYSQDIKNSKLRDVLTEWFSKVYIFEVVDEKVEQVIEDFVE